jgi:hypothetical protein
VIMFFDEINDVHLFEPDRVLRLAVADARDFDAWNLSPVRHLIDEGQTATQQSFDFLGVKQGFC